MTWELWGRNRMNRHFHGASGDPSDLSGEFDVRRTKTKRKSQRTLSQALLTGSIKFAGHVEVRGGYYHNMWEAKVDGVLVEGAWLKMVREPENQHDCNAIAVIAPNGDKIGYVAKERAELLAPFMDIGVKMALRVLTHSGANQPIRLTTRLYIKK